MRLFLYCICFLYGQSASGWGFWAHQRINYMACFTLPPELFGFYKPNIGYVFEHAVDPDKRRYSDPQEAPRHYMDLDRYGGVDAVPHRWNEAVEKYSEDTLVEHGIVPWAIQRFYYALVRSFTERDQARILYYSAVLGHYVGDAHVPLHCTRNYNGQLTGQKGIHGFWESRLPELFGDGFDLAPGPCKYLDDPLRKAWDILRESSAAVDSVLLFERQLDSSTAPDQKFAFEDRGNITVKTYSAAYAKKYLTMLDGQVERRMYLAILRVGSFWYSAWVDAGQPHLFSMPQTDSTESIMDNETAGSFLKILKERICEDQH